MSGLTPVTRSLLRVAYWIAGKAHSQWCAAMAAETDAAGSNSYRWALGCVGAALRMRLSADWKRVATLALLPILVNFAEHAIFLPAAMAAHADWLSSWAIVPLSIILPLALIFWSGWSAPGPFPVAFVIYLLVMQKLWPMAVFTTLTGSQLPLSVWFGSNSTYWMLPALLGMALSSALYFAALYAGYKAGETRRLRGV